MVRQRDITIQRSINQRRIKNLGAYFRIYSKSRNKLQIRSRNFLAVLCVRFTPLSVFFRYLVYVVYRFDSSIIFSYYFFVGREALDVQRKKTKERKGNKEDNGGTSTSFRTFQKSTFPFETKRRKLLDTSAGQNSCIKRVRIRIEF